MSDFTYRIAPVHYTDIDGMESWLQDMAAQGLVLGQEGIFSGLCAFEKTTPKNYKYRLIANTFKYGWTGGRFNRYAPVPDEETQTFHKEFGWEYVATRKDFNIYVAKDPSAPEMDTDPQIQATAIHAAVKRKKWDMFWTGLAALFYLLSLAWMGTEYLIGTRTYFYFGDFFILPIWLLFFIQHAYAHARLKKIQESLLSGLPLEHQADYRRGRGLYWASRCIEPLLLIALFITIFNVRPRYNDYDSMTDLSDYTGPIPFATMEDLLPEAQFREDSTWNNYIVTKSTPFAETLRLHQQLHVTLPDGTKTSGNLNVTYLETIDDWAARFAAWRNSNSRRGARELTVEGADYAFTDDIGATYSYVVICKDNICITVNFQFFHGTPLTPEEIAAIVVDSIENGDGSH